MHPITTRFAGRVGNIFYQTAMLVAYGVRHNIPYHVPDKAPHQPDGKNPFRVKSTAPHPPFQPIIYPEPSENGQAVYQEIPARSNIMFSGYWQSFRYIDDCRKEVLEAFELPDLEKIPAVSIHVRRGDFLKLDAFQVMPLSYYQNAVKEFGAETEYWVFSDDIPWCRSYFTEKNFPGCRMRFIDKGTELEDFFLMARCEHNITANSSFSYAAAWINPNPDKIVVSPTREMMWYNRDMVPDYFKTVSC